VVNSDIYLFKQNLIHDLSKKKYCFFLIYFLQPNLLNEIKYNYITQGCSLHFFKSSRGVGVETVERDNIL
jgi:hypothetical protein